MNKSISFTSGPILSTLIKYTVPLIFTNLIQVFYGIADSIIVGMSGETEAVGAIGTTTAFINLVVNMFIGCSIGTKVVVARYVGEKNSKKVENAVHTSIAASLLLSAICLAVVMPLTTPILSAMGNRGKLRCNAHCKTNRGHCRCRFKHTGQQRQSFHNAYKQRTAHKQCDIHHQNSGCIFYNTVFYSSAENRWVLLTMENRHSRCKQH